MVLGLSFTCEVLLSVGVWSFPLIATWRKAENPRQGKGQELAEEESGGGGKKTPAANAAG